MKPTSEIAAGVGLTSSFNRARLLPDSVSVGLLVQLSALRFFCP